MHLKIKNIFPAKASFFKFVHPEPLQLTLSLFQANLEAGDKWVVKLEGISFFNPLFP